MFGIESLGKLIWSMFENSLNKYKTNFEFSTILRYLYEKIIESLNLIHPEIKIARKFRQ